MTIPKLTEIWDQEDDWTGVMSAAERKKRQNRLNQRAWRKRRALKNMPSATSDSYSANGVQSTAASSSCPTASNTNESLTLASTSVGPVEPNAITQSGFTPAWVKRLPLLLILSECAQVPEIRDRVVEFLPRAASNWSLALPRLSDLPAVTRLNAFDALCRNALALLIPLALLEGDDNNSPFSLPTAAFHDADADADALAALIPPDLAPTALQRRVPHHPWLDLFPVPGLRDNVLRGVADGRWDEDTLCEALCCDMLNLDGAGVGLLIVWGELWDGRGWEFSPEFFRRWGMLLKGAPGVLETTNYWREKRGEMRIQFVMNGE